MYQHQLTKGKGKKHQVQFSVTDILGARCLSQMSKLVAVVAGRLVTAAKSQQPTAAAP